ncbi:hypothetical protein MRB53_016995 [Persea americana]|uniref:Uncharacterized protein n=1 Tax=Persea americana TaxID=3435 RepID=A0ACC2M3F8_PERAE|nr:hypothetical protein MRB53_016995 [Persea americana]
MAQWWSDDLRIPCSFSTHNSTPPSFCDRLLWYRSRTTTRSRSSVLFWNNSKDLGLEVIVIGDDLTKKIIQVGVARNPPSLELWLRLTSLDSSLGGHLHRRKSSQASRFSSVAEQST